MFIYIPIRTLCIIVFMILISYVITEDVIMENVITEDVILNNNSNIKEHNTEYQNDIPHNVSLNNTEKSQLEITFIRIYIITPIIIISGCIVICLYILCKRYNFKLYTAWLNWLVPIEESPISVSSQPNNEHYREIYNISKHAD